MILIVFGFMSVFFAKPIQADTMYVIDVLKLRLWDSTGPGRTFEKVIVSGMAVEVIGTDGAWSQVRTRDGHAGWVQSRFLSSRATSNIKLARLERKHKALTIQNSVLLEENAKLKSENKTLGKDHDQVAKTFNEISQAYESLKSESAGYLKLKEDYQNATAKLDRRNNKIKDLEKELESYKTNHTVRWFLTGAGVLMGGFIFGFSIRPKRRRSLLG